MIKESKPRTTRKSNSKYEKLISKIEPLLEANEVALVYSKLPNEVSPIRSSKDVSMILWPYFEHLCELKEQMVAITLNRINQVLGITRMSSGSRTGTVLDISHLCAVAFLQNASGVIIAHNHPSGSLRPSEADVNLTKKTKSALKLHDIDLHDHLIMVGSQGLLSSPSYYSFADEGLI